MKQILALWSVSLRSSYRARWGDSRMRTALFLFLLLAIVGGIWSTYQLADHLRTWQQQGPGVLSRGLWLYCGGTWSGLGIMALISLRQAFATDEILLLSLLPLPPATRFRALLGSFFLEHLLSLALLQALVMLFVLLSVLGWPGLSWFLLIQLGTIITISAIFLTALLVIHYTLNDARTRTQRVFLAGSAGILLLLILSSILLIRPLVNVQELRPEVVLLLFILLLLLCLGPGAAPAGRLYLSAFRITQSWDRGQRTFTFPGLSWLTRLLARRRTLTAAFFVRALHNQSRNLFFWFRLLTVWLIVLLGFPLVRPFLLHLEVRSSLLVIAGASGLALLHLLEPGACAISGEGNRFALYLTAPYSLSQILQARLLSCLLPLLLETLLISMYLSWQLQIGLTAFGPVFLAILLIVTSSTTLLVLGSAWDLDLNEAVEGAMQALLLEEVPLTPRKMLLSLLCLLTITGMFLLLYWLPLALALPCLMLLAGLLILLTWHFSLRFLALSRQ